MKSQDCVTFKVNYGLSNELLLEISQQAERFGWDYVKPVDVQSIAVLNWVGLKCQYGCKNYNKNWCCPPATPEPEQVRIILSEYCLALLLVGSLRNPEIYYSKNSRVVQVRQWKASIALERILFLHGYYKAFSLISGACPLCKTCNYPLECKFPLYKRPSVESFSIDFIKTLENMDLKSIVAMGENESFNFYSLILVE